MEDQYRKGEYEMSDVEYRQYTSVAAMITATGNLGNHFFEPSSMQFFHSRISDKLHGGRFFVTSEKSDYSSPRRYTVRVMCRTFDSDGQPFASIQTVGEFQAHRSSASAHKAAAKYAQAVDNGMSVEEILWSVENGVSVTV
jgi:hypothetical protein